MAWSLMGTKCGICGNRTRGAVPAPPGASLGLHMMICEACAARLKSEADQARAEAKRRKAMDDDVLDAAFRGDAGAVQSLLASGAYVNAANNNGATPLNLASETGHAEVVKVLLAAGANVDAARNDGVTPHYIASQGGHTDVVKLLLAAGAKKWHPTFKVVILSVSVGSQLIGLLSAVASQTGICPKDIPENWDVKENCRLYHCNPWWGTKAAGQEALETARREWGKAILDENRNEIILRPFRTNFTSDGIMCVIRDKFLFKPRQLLQCIDHLNFGFHYFWHDAPQEGCAQMRKLLHSFPDLGSVTTGGGSTQIEFSATCFDEEDVLKFDSAVKKVAEEHGGVLERIRPDSCPSCSGTTDILGFKYGTVPCPYCGKKAEKPK